jgi:hypothetical protein
MKRKNLILITISLFLALTVSGQNGSAKKINPAGSWKYEAPSAPYGYNSGIITVGFAEKKYTVTISLTGSEYKIQGEQVKYENDNLSCTVFIEGEGVKVNLKAENGTKMTGTADYSQGQIPLTMTRTIPGK